MQDILTEKEAMTRWCPMGRFNTGGDEPTSFNRVSGFLKDKHPDMMCIASECMAWRLAHKPSASNEETGFCGAFGVPRHT